MCFVKGPLKKERMEASILRIPRNKFSRTKTLQDVGARTPKTLLQKKNDCRSIVARKLLVINYSGLQNVHDIIMDKCMGLRPTNCLSC